MWKGHAAYSRVYAEDTATYGGLIQLTMYLWTLVCITVFFSLFPNAESAIIKANDDVGRTYEIRDGHRSTPMRIFRQFAAFGAQSLYAYVLHVALLILVERLGFFDVTWRVQLVDFSSSELIDFSTGQESLSETQPLGRLRAVVLGGDYCRRHDGASIREKNCSRFIRLASRTGLV